MQRFLTKKYLVTVVLITISTLGYLVISDMRLWKETTELKLPSGLVGLTNTTAWAKRCSNLVVPSLPAEVHGAHYAVLPNAVREKSEALRKIRQSFGLHDVLFTVTTTSRYHRKRLQILLDTWVSLVPNQTFIMSDGNDTDYQRMLPDGHFILSNCPSSHGALCCKTGLQLDMFMDSPIRYKWFCRLDDDTYVNFAALEKLLAKHNSSKKVILGPTGAFKRKRRLGRIVFVFGSGGMCLTRQLLQQIYPHVGKGKFVQLCAANKLADDVTLGYVAMKFGQTKATDTRKIMNKHHDTIKAPSDLINQVTFSYRDSGVYPFTGQLALPDGAFSISNDPSRFYSLHARFYPSIPFCRLPKKK